MSELQPEAFDTYARRCWVIFAAIVCVTLLMVGTSLVRLENHHLTIGLILTAAVVNASLVGGYLMHLFTERKTIYAVLAFTAIFFIALMGLTLWASHDHPKII